MKTSECGNTSVTDFVFLSYLFYPLNYSLHSFLRWLMSKTGEHDTDGVQFLCLVRRNTYGGRQTGFSLPMIRFERSPLIGIIKPPLIPARVLRVHPCVPHVLMFARTCFGHLLSNCIIACSRYRIQDAPDVNPHSREITSGKRSSNLAVLFERTEHCLTMSICQVGNIV